MAEWWQNPAYDARLAAGQVQTPGLVDWGGMANDVYTFLQAPYERRMDQQSVGFDKSIPEDAWQTTQSSRLTPFTPYAPLPNIPPGALNGDYSAQPRIASNARSSAPAPRVASAPGVGSYLDYPTSPYMGEPNRLPPSGGIDPVQRVAFNLPGGGSLSGGGFDYPAYTARPRTASALDAIDKAAPGGPSFPLRGGGALNGAPPNYGNYRASMRLAPMLPSGGQGGDVLRLPFDPMSETSGQNMANSSGRPVAGPSGKTYYPTNQATDRVRAPMSPVAERATQKPTGLFGGLFGGTGGLFGGGMFGGGQQAPRNPAGLPIATAGPVINGATYGITATGSVGDYGSSPGQITAGLQPGERKFDASTNSWGLR